MRVISVLPSATEIVHALGHGPELVGRSSECDYPTPVRSLPSVMRPRTLDSDRPSRAIDERVRAARARNESLYELDLELLRSLRPDLLLTQNLCGVCSVTEGEVTEACARAGVRPAVVSLAPTRLAEVWDSFETVGAALHDPPSGAALANACRRRARTVRGSGATVAVVEWLDPPILSGLWTPEIVLSAGGTPVGPGRTQPGTRTSWEALQASPPDLLIVGPCSFTVDRTMRELEQNPSLSAEVRAVRARLGTFVADEAYFSRPGPRLADGIDLIRSLLREDPPHGPMPVVAFEPPTSRPTQVRA